MKIEIDQGSGFCFGVTRAIGKAEEELATEEKLYCLGDIVHNGKECDRLQQLGLVTINHHQLHDIHDAKVLLRAHGDADIEHQKQIVIFGKNGHAEVIGLVGQTEETAIIIESSTDVEKLDFSRDICLYSQTTMPLDEFRKIVEYVQQHISPEATFTYYDTICRQVANRMPNIRNFALKHDVVLFVCGRKSSNGRVLFNECCKANPRSYMIDTASEIDVCWLQGSESIGICGATSTPKWLMEECKVRVEQLLGSNE